MHIMNITRRQCFVFPSSTFYLSFHVRSFIFESVESSFRGHLSSGSMPDPSLYLASLTLQTSVDEAEAMMKRHEELEARLAAQDERLAAFAQRADALSRQPHHARER